MVEFLIDIKKKYRWIYISFPQDFPKSLESFVIKLSSYEPHEFSKLFRCFYGQNLVRILYTYTTIRSVRFARKKGRLQQQQLGRLSTIQSRRSRGREEAASVRGSKATPLLLSLSLPRFYTISYTNGRVKEQANIQQLLIVALGKHQCPNKKASQRRKASL